MSDLDTMSPATAVKASDLDIALPATTSRARPPAPTSLPDTSTIRQIRQGDVLFTRLSTTRPTAGMKPCTAGTGDSGRSTISLMPPKNGSGEGSHVLTLTEGTRAYSRDASGRPDLIEVSDFATVTHDEHDIVLLAPGQWEVSRRRQIDPNSLSNVVPDLD